MALNKLLDNGTRSLTVLYIELGSRDVKLITVAMLRLLTIPTSYYCCMWMMCLLQGLALRRLIIWRSNCPNSLQWRIWELQSKSLVWESSETRLIVHWSFHSQSMWIITYLHKYTLHWQWKTINKGFFSCSDFPLFMVSNRLSFVSWSFLNFLKVYQAYKFQILVILYSYSDPDACSSTFSAILMFLLRNNWGHL